MVKVLKISTHLIKHVLYRDIHLFHDPLINVSYNLLNDFELFEKLATSFQNILRKDIFLTIDPKVRESFLSSVQDLSQIAKRPLLIQYLVCFRELLTVFPCGTDGLESFAKALNLV